MTDIKPQFNRNQHGSLYDRGSADSYYHRPITPHWYPEGSYKGERITKLSLAERAEYVAGYTANEEAGNFK